MEEKILFVLKNVLGLESATKALSQQNCDKWDSLRHLNLIAVSYTHLRAHET